MMKKNEPVMPKDSPRFKWTMGSTSLMLFFLLIGTAIPMAIWNTVRYYQNPSDLGAGMLMGFLCLLFWLPLLIASFAIGGMAITKDKGRTQGIIAVSAITFLILWVIIQSHLH